MRREHFEQMLTEIEVRLNFVNDELMSLPEGELMITKRSGKQDFMQVIYDGNQRHRRGINKNNYLVRDLCRKKYLTQERMMLANNKTAMECLLKSYSDISADTVLSMLPERFRQLPEEYFFADNKIHSWPEAVRHWASESFEQSTYNPEEKDKTTSRGLKVRTKSGIKYWEHAGKINDPGYVRKHNWKLSIYQRAGIVPWKNLIITYDDLSGGIDTRIIESEIVNKLL